MGKKKIKLLRKHYKFSEEHRLITVILAKKKKKRKHYKGKITLIPRFSARFTKMKQGIIISGILEERKCAAAFCLSRLLNKLTRLELSNILPLSSSIKGIKLSKVSSK